jgi:3-oxoadipate enol-lactonase
MAKMTINDQVFNVLVEGADDAPALILSNSLGTNLHMWDRQIPALIERFKVVRYDSRGHGDSTVAEGPYSIAQLGADALAIMDALGIARAHWLGLSKGGMVGQWLLTNAPDRIDRAILANTAAHMPPADMWNDRIRTVRELGIESISPGVLDRWFTPNFQSREPAVVKEIEAMLLSTSAEGYAAGCAAIRDLDMREALRGVDKPVLVIVGNHDPATPPERGKLIADTIAGARLVSLDAAHLSNIEATEAFNQAIVDFLTEMPASRAQERRRRAQPRARQSGAQSGSVSAAAPKKRASGKPSAQAATIAKAPASQKSTAKASRKPAAKTATKSRRAGSRKAASAATKAATAKTRRSTPTAKSKARPSAAKSTAAKSKAGKSTAAKSARAKSARAKSARAKSGPAKSRKQAKKATRKPARRR